MNKDRVVHKGKWLNFVEKETETGTWEYVERVGKREAVIIIGITEDNKMALIEQVRAPFGKKFLEFPAGLIDDGETPEQAAVRSEERRVGKQWRTPWSPYQ